MLRRERSLRKADRNGDGKMEEDGDVLDAEAGGVKHQERVI